MVIKANSSNYGGFNTTVFLTAINGNSNVISYDGTILNTTNPNTVLSSISGGVNVAIGELYRDMGKKLYVQQNGINCAIFTYAQLVDDAGAVNEGVPNVPNIWICTWQAAGTTCVSPYGMVRVVRSA